MQNTRLANVLKSFSAPELRRFGDYVKSPFFNKNKHVIALFDSVKNCHPDFNSSTKEEIFSRIFPYEKYRDEKMRNIMSDLLKLAEDFLSYTAYEKRVFEREKYLVDELKLREIDSIFRSELKHAEQTVDESVVKDDEYYFKHTELMKLLREYEENKLNFSKAGLEQEMQSFVIYFLIKMLKYYCIVTNEERRTGIKIEKVLFEDIMNFLNRHPELFERAPAVRIFHNLLLLNQREDGSDQFEKVQALLAENRDFITREDIRTAHRYLHNYCQHCCKCLDSEFGIECFKLVKTMIKEEDLFAKNRYINEHTFVCVVTAALQAEDPDWAEKFIDKHKCYLPSAVRDETSKYAAALLNFYTGQYQNSLKLLQACTGDNVYHYLRRYNLLLKNNYELGNMEEVIANSEAIRKHLSKDKGFPEYIKGKFINYLKFIGKLCSAKFRKNGIQLEQLERELKEGQDVEDKVWLLEKVKELGSR
jgi:hypothetical protein